MKQKPKQSQAEPKVAHGETKKVQIQDPKSKGSVKPHKGSGGETKKAAH